MNGREYQAIEQNPDKPSQWGGLRGQGIRSCSLRTIGRTNSLQLRWTERSLSTGAGVEETPRKLNGARIWEYGGSPP